MRTATALRFARMVAVVLATGGVGAETTYRWIDPGSGRTVISDLPPPPGARQVVRYTTSTGVGEPQLSYAIRQASEKFPVVLFTSVGCVSCKEARALLDRRGVPFTERVVNSEEELAELARQLGGETPLPSISVGRQSTRGFSPATWNELLDAAGYPASAPYRVRPATAPAE
jgi:glutaredoxin